MDQFRTVPLVLFEGACPWQDNLLDTLRETGRAWRVAFESTSLDAILAATQSGLGIAVLPREFVRGTPGSLPSVILPCQWRQRLSLVYLGRAFCRTALGRCSKWFSVLPQQLQ